ncbi:M28 family metallopeptidase [Tepidibacter mesophilus]|uniref:M28 family metallopeptidase n=1 Tax=Tepidibacter mesophilus TaxID=655607 RepID=UPI000C0805F8|nr:M28 family metallopeptidase [Tepidibacter mesophilus]
MFKFKKIKSVCLLIVMIMCVTSVGYANPISDNISTENMYNHLLKIANEDNARVAGLEGEYKAADYIHQELEKYGLNVERQKFPMTARLDSASCVITESKKVYLNSTNFSYSPATPPEGITAEIVFAGLGAKSDFKNIDVKGKIALIKRGAYSFYEKTQNAVNAGAIGVIIYNNDIGVIKSGTLEKTTNIPAIALSGEDGDSLKSKLDSKEVVKATIKADNVEKNSYSENIIGTLNSDNPNAKTIVIGAHYDCVDTPGANDNGSGTVSLLEIARVLSSEQLNYNIKFIAFGSEEIGLIGSEKYVRDLSQSELNNIHCMINLDMVGVGDTLGIFTSKRYTNSFIADLTEQYASKLGIRYKRDASTRSDHAPFEAVGIPVSFLMYEQDENYHTDKDTIENIQLENLKNSCTIVTQMVCDISNVSPKKVKDLKMLKVKDNIEIKLDAKENNYDKSKLDEYDFENPEFIKE